jgi:MFS family permease
MSLSPTGSQWIVNGYLLSLSALFALGGKIADVYGRRRMVNRRDRLRALLGAALAFIVALRAMPGGKAEQAQPVSGEDSAPGIVPAAAGESG